MSKRKASKELKSTDSGTKKRRKRGTFGWTHVKKGSNSVHNSEPTGLAKPPRFSWVVDGLLAAHGRPTKPGHLDYLVKHGVNVLITLTQNKPTVMDRYQVKDLEWVHIPVKDEKPPSQEQVRQFIATVDRCQKNNQMASVHCAWGRGRTGTMLACYLVKSRSLTDSDAIQEVRRIRPGSIDTKEQENVVKLFYSKHKK